MIQRIDDALMPLLNRGAANPFLDWLMPRITNLHHRAWFLALLILAVLYVLWKGGRNPRLAIICALVAVTLSDLFAYRVIKQVAPRERPCQRIAESQTRLVPGEDCPGSPSFPSNHASNMMALATVAWWFARGNRKEEQPRKEGRKWLSLLWFLIPLIIGYSRIYLGYHYPSDVVGGWILGALIACLVVVVAGRLKEPAAIPEPE